jgi:hypothetical protein
MIKFENDIIIDNEYKEIEEILNDYSIGKIGKLTKIVSKVEIS